MAERYPGDGAAANGFGRRHLQEPEALLLYEVEYPAPPDMRVLGAWRLSAGGVPVPPVPEGAAWWAEIARIRSSLTEEQRNEPRYVPDSETLWTLYFQARREEQIASTNGVIPRGRLNSKGRREWWGVPGRTLDAVLDHIETGNPGSSSSSGSGSPAVRLVKPEPEETPLGRRARSSTLVINEPSPATAPTRHSLRLVRPKPEPDTVPVKPEHASMVAPDDEFALKWAREDYVHEQVRQQRRAYPETQARSCAEEGGVIVIDSNDEVEAGPSCAVGDPGEGCSRDAAGEARDDDDDDYTRYYRLLGM
nr:receptor-like protein 12 [Triticum aestivum]